MYVLEKKGRRKKEKKEKTLLARSGRTHLSTDGMFI